MITERVFEKAGITIRQLKDILSNIPDFDEFGQPYEIWLKSGDSTSSQCVSIWPLNKTEDGCDILLEYS